MPRILSLVLFLAALPFAAAADDTAMVVACTQTVQDYAWYLDHPGEDVDTTAQAFAALFTEDAVLTLHDAKMEEERFVGHDAIAGRYKRDRRARRILHVMTNVRIEPTSASTATGTNYVQVHLHPVGGSLDEGGVTGVAEYRDVYRFEGGVCRISKRTTILRIGPQRVITDPAP